MLFWICVVFVLNHVILYSIDVFIFNFFFPLVIVRLNFTRRVGLLLNYCCIVLYCIIGFLLSLYWALLSFFAVSCSSLNFCCTYIDFCCPLFNFCCPYIEIFCPVLNICQFCLELCCSWVNYVVLYWALLSSSSLCCPYIEVCILWWVYIVLVIDSVVLYCISIVLFWIHFIL